MTAPARPDRAQTRRILWLGFACSLGVVLALYLAGGWRPYVNAPAGFHYGINSPCDAITLLLPPGRWVQTQQLLLILRAALAGWGICLYLTAHFSGGRPLFAPLCAGMRRRCTPAASSTWSGWTRPCCCR